MLTIEEIRNRLRDRNIQAVAARTGLSAASIYRVLKEDGNPLYQTVKTLSDYLEAK